VIGGLVDWTGNWSLAFSASIAVIVFGFAATLVVGRRMLTDLPRSKSSALESAAHPL